MRGLLSKCRAKSPGLVVMGGGSRSKGRGVESRMEMTFFHINLL